MSFIFDICCGEEEEKSKYGGFMTAEELHAEETSPPEPKRVSAREKAAVALELRHAKSIFSSPLDVKAEFKPNVYEKSESEQDFLRETMQSHLLFQELSEKELQTLVDATEKQEAKKGSKVFQQSEHGEYLYIVQKGRLDVYCERRDILVEKVSKGTFIGELELLYGNKHAHSLIAEEDSVLWRIDQQTYRYVLARHAFEQDVDISTRLSNIDLFKDLSDSSLQKFAQALTRVRFQEGDRIVTKGEIGEVFYIIEQGSVRAHDIGMGDSQVVDQILKAGDSFGERALLTGEPRAANVTALTDVTTLAMDKATLQRNLGELQGMMETKAKVQSLKGLPIFANSNLVEAELERLAELTVEMCYPKGRKLAEAGKPHTMNVWIIRGGQLLIYGGKSGKIYNLQTGDSYGDKSILGDPNDISTHDATCENNLTTWVLSRDDIEAVIIDLSRLGESEGFVKKKKLDKDITGLRDLKKHHILGQGGFGKVWLVESRSAGTPYALKVINKRQLLVSHQERSVLREKELLGLLHHPFILCMESSFQDATNLYLVLPLIQGGELFNVVQARASWGRGIPNNEAAFYAGGVIEALGHFHHRYIAYRDLKLENVMIDTDGYVKIVDLGFSKVIVDQSYTFCGTPDYLAPEIIMSKGHNHAVDYWSFGVLVYELLVGTSPFNKPGLSQMDMFKRIVLVQYEFPSLIMDNNSKDLIQKLLVRRVSDRLGMLNRGYYDVRNHPWFPDYKKLIKKELTPPWLPEVKDPLDSSNFDDFSHVKKEFEGMPLSKTENAVFAEF